jgi:hypothetical protein
MSTSTVITRPSRPQVVPEIVLHSKAYQLLLPPVRTSIARSARTGGSNAVRPAGDCARSGRRKGPEA